ncbi:MAG: YceH family protein [Acidimicrobiia bacterium]
MEPLTPEEVRVAGCLVEKQMTTPDSYPLTHNALVTACNQLSNRNPVVSYDDSIVMHALAGLRAKQLARMLHVPGSRGPKHRHVLDETLELDRGEVALLAVLGLRGPQTVGELRSRTERMHPFASLSEVEETLERLGARPDPLVIRLERQPGQKEARYTHLLSGLAAAEEAAAAMPFESAAEPAAPRAPRPAPVDDERLANLEARLAAVEADLAALRAELGVTSPTE